MLDLFGFIECCELRAFRVRDWFSKESRNTRGFLLHKVARFQHDLATRKIAAGDFLKFDFDKVKVRFNADFKG
jgi:hypothetical protein